MQNAPDNTQTPSDNTQTPSQTKSAMDSSAWGRKGVEWVLQAGAELLNSLVENWSSDIASPNYSLSFTVFSKFVKQMHFDNDAAESWVRLLCNWRNKGFERVVCWDA